MENLLKTHNKKRLKVATDNILHLQLYGQGIWMSVATKIKKFTVSTLL